MRKLITLIITILIAIILLSIYFVDYAHHPLSDSDEEIHLSIVPGMSFSAVSQQLVQRGLLDEKLPWDIFGRLSGATNAVKAGEYLLPANLTPTQLLHRLISGDIIQFSMTVIEGWTFNQLWEAVKQHDKITHTVSTPAELLAKLALGDMHPEGWFYPDTYYFPAGTTDVDFFRRAFEHMVKVLNEEWSRRKQGIPIHSPHEALTLASIIEKETNADAERAIVAAVFITRLKRGMRLQTDPTVIYGMGELFNGDIRRQDLKADTPYNTYLHKGLPPTPIALPGRNAIAAALNPADSEAVFFVSKGDGTHHFSNTYEEHKEAVIKYQLKGR